MKKWPFLLLAAALHSAPIGNPSSPALIQDGLFVPDTVWCQPRASFSEDFIASQKLSGSRHYTHVGRIKIDAISSLGAATWSIMERFDLSFVAGSGQEKIAFSLNDAPYRAKFKHGLIWYGEAKLVVLEVKDTTLSGYGQAGGWDWMSGPLTSSAGTLGRHANLQMRFWAAGATLSQKIGSFSPYGGVIVMRSRWKLDHTGIGGFNLHQKYPVGPLVGLSYCNTSKILLNGEWRGWVENAFTLSAEVRF